MANYFLFLDELKANDTYDYFCVGGCLVEEQHYRKDVVPQINNLKNTVFGQTSIILHEVDVRKKQGKYRVLNNDEKTGTLWSGLENIYQNNNMYTLCAGVHKGNLKSYYPMKNEQDSEYYIALQIILENFVHFLIKVNGTGCVYFESRDMHSDFALYKCYEKIRQNGTLFISPILMQKHLKCINFPLKIDNNIGLQLADFILNPVARSFQGLPQRSHNIYNVIKEKAYSGNINNHERFGFVKIL